MLFPSSGVDGVPVSSLASVSGVRLSSDERKEVIMRSMLLCGSSLTSPQLLSHALSIQDSQPRLEVRLPTCAWKSAQSRPRKQSPSRTRIGSCARFRRIYPSWSRTGALCEELGRRASECASERVSNPPPALPRKQEPLLLPKQ